MKGARQVDTDTQTVVSHRTQPLVAAHRPVFVIVFVCVIIAAKERQTEADDHC